MQQQPSSFLIDLPQRNEMSTQRRSSPLINATLRDKTLRQREEESGDRERQARNGTRPQHDFERGRSTAALDHSQHDQEWNRSRHRSPHTHRRLRSVHDRQRSRSPRVPERRRSRGRRDKWSRNHDNADGREDQYHNHDSPATGANQVRVEPRMSRSCNTIEVSHVIMQKAESLNENNR